MRIKEDGILYYVLIGPMRYLTLTLLILLLAEKHQEGIIFQDISDASGLRPFLTGMMGHAAAWGDVDQDGFPDLFVGGFCDRPKAEYGAAGKPVPPRLFRNMGNGKFQLLRNSGVELCGRTAGAAFADLNQDNFPDLIVANNSLIQSTEYGNPQSVASKVYKNDRGRLVQVAASGRVFTGQIPRIRSIGVLDYDGDGLLDILFVQDKLRKVASQSASVLLRNTGEFRFVDVTHEAGLPPDLTGLGVAIADLNADRRPDFFITHSNRLFVSGADKRFRETQDSTAVFKWEPQDAEDWPSGAAFGDLNNDGRLDLIIVAHHNPARNRLYINRGVKQGLPVFEDVTSHSVIKKAIPTKTPHVEIQDFDNDGWKDLFFSAAWTTNNKILPLIYRNKAGPRNGIPMFEVSTNWKHSMIYFPGAPVTDFNRDGKMDIFLVNWFPDRSSYLLLNHTDSGNWLQIKAPIGTAIKLTSHGKIMGYAQIYPGYGFSSGQEPYSHFGLGRLKSIDVELTFPDGKVKRVRAAATNRRMEFR